MMNIILATTKNMGIGLQNNMAWMCKEELKLFKQKTLNSILIMGRKTVDNLPYLKDREILCITRDKNIKSDINRINNINYFNNIDSAIQYAKGLEKKIFIAGGAEIYNLVLNNYPKELFKVHLSIMKKDYYCDKFIKYDFFPDWVIMEKIEHEEFTHYVLKYNNYGENQYLNILKNVIENGEYRAGRNGCTKSIFGQHLKFDLTKGFPLFTTRKSFWRGVVEELLFFIKGETNSKILEEKNINIWKGNTSRKFLDDNNMKFRKEGMMGPMYGYQWRNFNAKYDEKTGKPTTPGLDQLKIVIEQIKNNPTSRRILMTDFNPFQASEGVLFPCHSIILQFYVDNEFIDIFCFNRSSDLFHGLNFNVPSTSLLLMIIAKMTNLKPRYVNISLGDSHIYFSHIKAVKEQLLRQPYELPTVSINKEINNISDLENLEYKDFTLENYKSHGAIKVDMVV